jgi:hypothetical protein
MRATCRNAWTVLCDGATCFRVRTTRTAVLDANILHNFELLVFWYACGGYLKLYLMCIYVTNSSINGDFCLITRRAFLKDDGGDVLWELNTGWLSNRATSLLSTNTRDIHVIYTHNPFTIARHLCKATNHQHVHRLHIRVCAIKGQSWGNAVF